MYGAGALGSFWSPYSFISSLPPLVRRKRKHGLSGQVAFLGPPIMAVEFLRMLLLVLPHAWQRTQSVQSFLCILSPPHPACGLWQGWDCGSPGQGAHCLLTLTPTTPELLQPSCAGGPGVLSEQQVLGRLPWQEVRARSKGWRAASGMALLVVEPA